jgi:hypothetical protein
VQTKGGTQVSNKVGDIKNFGTVWYNPESLANILSLADVRKQCRVTMDTKIEPAMCVHRPNGKIMKFVEFVNGLYFHNPIENVTDYTFVSKVDQNKRMFTDSEVANADAALSLHRKLGCPSPKTFKQILKNGQIRNCPITVEDAKQAFIIYGPCAANLKGTATKSSADHVKSLVPAAIPSYITKHHKNITLCIDIFYVQKIAFFTTISRKIKFRTIAMLTDRTKSSILKQFNLVIKLYNSHGFSIEDIHSDHEFDCIRNDVLPTQLNVVAADAHVGDVARSIRTIKERVRSTIHGLPFRRLPKLMIRELVFAATKWLNQFPVEGGVSDTISPFTIMTGRPGLNYNKLQLEFGAYIQVFEDNNPTNTMKTRNTGAIALSHTGNAQGDYYFMSLETGKRLCRHAWTPLPMPNSVITMVEAMASTERQPIIEGGLSLFEINLGFPLNDDEDDDMLAVQANILDGPDDMPEFIDEPNNHELHFNVDNNNVDVAIAPGHQEAAADIYEDVALPVADIHEDVAMPVPEQMPALLIDNNDDVFADQRADPNDTDNDSDDNADNILEHDAPAEATGHPYSLRPDRDPLFQYRYDHQFLQCAIDTSSTN